MDRRKTFSALAIFFIICWTGASPVGGGLSAQLKPIQTVTPLKTEPPPAPVISAWGPRDKVATGEIIWVQGTNLNRDLLVLTLGDRTIMPHLYFEMLPAASSTATRIEFRTLPAMKTGVKMSTPLKVLHRGAAPVMLDEDYHVIDRLARFSGSSRYHKGETAAFGIYSEGTVQLELNNLDFANEGSGTYKEQIRLIREVRKTTEPCPVPFVFLTKTTIFYDFTPISAQRPITWKRDASVPTRILLYGVGPARSEDVTANVMPDFRIECGYAAYVGRYGPFSRESGCPGVPDITQTIEEKEVGGPRFQLVPAQEVPPLQPTPPSFIFYTVRRMI